MIDFKSLFAAGVQFGHQRKRLCPKMNRFIWGQKSGVSLIDVSQTAQRLEMAANFLKSIAEAGGHILWVGTKKPAKKAIGEAAEQTGMPWVNHRWIGGTLSNFSQVKKSVTKLLHLEDSIQKADDRVFVTKKELSVMRKTIDRLRQNIGGIQSLTWPVKVIVVVDVKKERSAVREASRMGVPIVGIVDTNSDPSMVDYVIPSNDDAPQAVSLLVAYLKSAAQEGIELAKKRRAIEEEQKKKEAAAKAKESAQAIKESAAKRVEKKAPKKAAAKDAVVKVKGAPSSEAKKVEKKGDEALKEDASAASKQ